MTLLQVISPVLGLLSNCLFQITTKRLFPSISLMRSVHVGFLAGVAFLMIFELFVIKETFYLLLTSSLMIYIAESFCYFNLITLCITARRVRILRELYEKGQEGLTLPELLSRYNANDMVQIRVKRLMDSGQVIFKQDKFYVGNPTVLVMAKILTLMKILLLGQKTTDTNRIYTE